jgi:hypothetical protein
MFDGGTRSVAGMADDEIVERVRVLIARRRRIDAEEARLLGELESRATCDRDFGLSTSSWLAMEAGLPHGVARSRVNVARKLMRSLHETSDALARGDISWEQARVLADAANPRIETDLAIIEGELLAAGDGVGVDRWRQEVQGIASLLDRGHDPADDIESNRLHVNRSADVLSLSGSLVGEHALITQTAIDHVADELFRLYTEITRSTRPSPSPPARRSARSRSPSSAAAASPATSSRPHHRRPKPSSSSTPTIPISRHATSTASASPRSARGRSDARPGSSPRSSTHSACHSRWDARSAPPTVPNDVHSRSATAAASSPGAQPRSVGATHTTSSNGTTAEKPTSTTSRSSAGDTTAPSTEPDGPPRSTTTNA